jgi:hypothetical protein
MPEWLIGAVCKTAVLTGFAGSNPALSTFEITLSGAQWPLSGKRLGTEKL